MLLKRWTLPAAAFVAMCMPVAAQDQAGARLVVPRLTVTGEATVNVAPDAVQIRVGVTTQAKTAKEASDANARTATALIAALKGAGIDDKDIQTARLSLQPTYEQVPNNPSRSRINGFQASNQVTVRIRDMAKTSDVIDRAVSAGATDIGGIDFVVTETSKELDKARDAAVADARRKAEIYARATGTRLGRVLMLSEDRAAPEPVAMARAAAAPPVMPGERALRLTVIISYELGN